MYPIIPFEAIDKRGAMATAIALKIAPVVDSKESEEVLDHANLASASEDEDGGDDEKHENLLKEISSLSSSGKKRQKRLQQRSEPNKTVSEFHLSVVKDSEQQVELSDLIGSLNKSSEHGNLKKKLDSMQRNAGTLDVPLAKPEVQKIQRTIAYGQTKTNVEKWAPTVKKNREADHLSFPLKPYTPPAASLRGLAVKFKPRTPLEEEVAAVLRGSSHVLERTNKELTEDEEKALLAMDLEEAKERRHELQKLRALQSYYEMKCHRMKKIKSKKYHRVKRKAELRAAAKMATGEDGENEDAAEIAEKADRIRAMERVSLKHRNTSKWAKHLMTKASKNADAKKLLQDQLRISRKLTEKTVESESDDELEEPAQDQAAQDDEDNYGNLLTSEDNPWRLDTKGTPLLAETTTGVDNDSSAKLYRLQPIRTEEADENGDEDSERGDDGDKSDEEFELQPVLPTEKGKKKASKQVTEGTKKKKKRKSEVVGEVEVTAKKSKKSGKTEKTNPSESVNGNNTASTDSIEGEKSASLKKKKSKKVSNKKLTDKSKSKIDKDKVKSVKSNAETEGNAWTNSSVDTGENSKNSTLKGDSRTETGISEPKDIRVDPKKIFRIEDQGGEAEDGDSDSQQQKRIDIQQAFANDDVVEQFVQEKSEIEEASKPQDIDLSLPGWGSWAGAGIKPSEKKKQLFTKKAEPAPPRKDKDLSHVIINEEKSKLFARNQVSAVPHPYGSHVQFERSVRNPVGKHWNTGTTVNQLIKPRVSTLIGTIIEPIKATKEIKRRKPEDRKKKKEGEKPSGITIHS